MYGLRDRYLRWVARRNDLYVPSLLADVRLTDEEVETVEALELLISEGEEADEPEPAPPRRRRDEPLVAASRSRR